MIVFGIALMAFASVRGEGPEYLNDVIVPVHSVGDHTGMRTTDHGDVLLQSTCTQHYRRCSFHLSVATEMVTLLECNFEAGFKTWLP